MPYCTQSDIEKLIPTQELAEITTEYGDTPDPVVISEAINQADSEIDSYCGKQYNVPFSLVPDRIKNLSIDMSIYHIYSRRSVVPEIREKKYLAAVKFLQDVSKGLAVIGSTATPPATATTEDMVEITSDTVIFNRSSLGDW